MCTKIEVRRSRTWVPRILQVWRRTFHLQVSKSRMTLRTWVPESQALITINPLLQSEIVAHLADYLLSLPDCLLRDLNQCTKEDLNQWEETQVKCCQGPYILLGFSLFVEVGICRPNIVMPIFASVWPRHTEVTFKIGREGLCLLKHHTCL